MAKVNGRHRSARDQVNRTFANQREDALHVAANRDYLRRRLSAKKTAEPRPDILLMDRDIFLEIQRSLAGKLWVRLTGRRGPAVMKRNYPVHLPTWEKIRANDARQLIQGIRDKTLWIPPWKHTGPRLKLLSWCIALRDTGITFNLHLTNDVIEQGRRCDRGFAYLIQQRMMRSLRKELSKAGLDMPDFFFVVEATSGIDEHVHGVIELAGHLGAMDAVRQALLSAAGFDGVKRNGTELRMRKMDYAPGWAEYVLKWTYQSALALDGSIIGATNSLRKRGEQWYRHARENDEVLDPKYADMDLMQLAERGLLD